MLSGNYSPLLLCDCFRPFPQTPLPLAYTASDLRCLCPCETWFWTKQPCCNIACWDVSPGIRWVLWKSRWQKIVISEQRVEQALNEVAKLCECIWHHRSRPVAAAKIDFAGLHPICGGIANSNTNTGAQKTEGSSLVWIPTRRRTVSVRHHRPNQTPQEATTGRYEI